jgi:chromosome partitioning protein
VQCEYYALEGLGQLLNTISIVKKHLNQLLDIEGVLLTMYDSRLRLSNQVASEVRRYFGDKVFQTIITRNVRLSEAPSHGKPVLLYDALSIGTKNYMDLATEILRRDGILAEPPAVDVASAIISPPPQSAPPSLPRQTPATEPPTEPAEKILAASASRPQATTAGSAQQAGAETGNGNGNTRQQSQDSAAAPAQQQQQRDISSLG